METKERSIPLKIKTADLHYIPPHARNANFQNDNMKERARMAKLKLRTKESRKACDDSSYLFHKEKTEEDQKFKIFQTNEKCNDGINKECESVIEVYGFREEMNTSDLIDILGSYTIRGFTLRWVDDTHALLTLPCPRLAEEILNADFPLIKTRPISEATIQSQALARSIILPSAVRPKTCTATAQRFISGALGLKISSATEQRAVERKSLRGCRNE